MNILHHIWWSRVGQIRKSGFLLACLLPLAAVTTAAEIASESSPLTFDGGAAATDCDCQHNRQPPWHGNVTDPCCNRPCCPPPNMFHADAWGQLGAKEEAKRHCLELPPSFPRFNGWRKGFMPSPKPIAMPRCHHCGMPVQPGM